ncbi:6-phosphogluconate dehydrogenase family protein isoform 1 [Hibiscus syriacus]|uniref:6-phosphogluconate dehydrogenase family protein isoform 1 n=1 Tax=Hibiscus syriacus TaxID=106335 RepID=A0A6A3CCP6_HIBSY|nr:uncharacterized protein LOC120203190 [Hibiscus syriacus]KAE8724929.1 6-phosphogluconate dehydrogenase family protein isoform 1 [Hibiscus syriacus]
MSFIFFSLVFFSLYIFSCVHGLDRSSNCSLDTFLQDFAFRALVITHRPHTGALYKANLPTDLSGMEVSIARIRSRTLWKQGANLSSFRIPSQTVPVPRVRRLAIVYENLGNRSSQYYSISGYSLITPVVGFMVFDASNARATRLRSIGIDTMGKPISIHFSKAKYSASARCATFSSNGTVDFSRIMLPNVCYTSSQGHFSVVVPLQRKQRPSYPWVIGVVLGFCALILVGYFGFVSIKLLKTKRVQAMERQADEGEILNNRWVSCSKMPSAAVTRTQPVLENGGFP